MFMLIYCGVVYGIVDDCYNKYIFGDIEDELLCIIIIGGWVSMLEYYFILVWVLF